MLSDEQLLSLQKTARQIRLELIKMFSYGKAHHFGGSLSCAEIVAALFFYKMNYSAKNMNDLERDRFIMSKGHSVPTQYVALSMLGIIPHDELRTIKMLGTRLQGHPDMLKTPGIEAPTGSLGMGLSFANGIATAARLDGLDFRIFVLTGDGELQEGQIWEAAMYTSHHHFVNICVIVDRNKYQGQGRVSDEKTIEPLLDKWNAFGWHAVSVDGHDLGQICSVLDSFNGANDKPFAIIADTIKGKGVSFMENTFAYHNASLSEGQYTIALSELQESIAIGNK